MEPKTPLFLGKMGGNITAAERSTSSSTQYRGQITPVLRTGTMWFPERDHNGRHRGTQGGRGGHEQKAPHLNKLPHLFRKRVNCRSILPVLRSVQPTFTPPAHTEEGKRADCHLVTFSHKLNPRIAGPAPNGNRSMRLPKFVRSDEFGFHPPSCPEQMGNTHSTQLAMPSI